MVIFPWSLVNIAGAFYWGWMARQIGFQKYLRTGRNSALSHGWFLYIFGVGGAIVMSLPGTFIQAALHEQTTFALNPDVAESVSQRVLKWEQTAHLYLESLFGFTWGESLSWWIVNWFQNWIRYVPDKTMSAAIALVVLKYGYPLFERELIHGGPEGERPNDERILPLVLGLLYAPSFAALLSSETYGGRGLLAFVGIALAVDSGWLLLFALLGRRRGRPAGSQTSTSRALCPRAETDRAGSLP